jgi:hypothetical protein
MMSTVLDVKRQRPVRIGLQGGEHRRVDQIAIDRVFNQQLRLAVIHGHRPERIDRRQLTFRECQRVIVLAPVQLLSFAVDQSERIGGLH